MEANLSDRRELSLNVPICVEFEDIDAYHIVHHVKIVAYLERARLRLLRALGIDPLGLDVAPVLYDLRVRYRKPAKLGDQLDAIVTVRDHDDYRIELRYRIRRE